MGQTDEVDATATTKVDASEGKNNGVGQGEAKSLATNARPIIYSADDGATSGLLPYQPASSATAADKVRFLLALPSAPLLIEAQIRIDDQPFQQARVNRIAELFDGFGKPVATKQTTNNTTPDAATEILLPPLEEMPPPPPPMLDTTPAARLARYGEATGRTPTKEEIGWLLNQWSGATLSTVNRNFERIRRNQAPALETLDRDNDGQLSKDELSQLRKSLLIADRNQDELVTFEELSEAAEAKRRSLSAEERLGIHNWDPPVPLVLLGDAHDATIWVQRLVTYYGEAGSSWPSTIDKDGDGKISPSEYELLKDAPPDIRIFVDFDSDDPAGSTLRVHDAESAEKSNSKSPSNEGPTKLHFHGVDIDVRIAVQEGEGDQVSLGAVIDGFPLLPHLDFNNDRRLTLREMNRAAKHLATFDIDKNEVLSANETPTAVRVVIGRGLVAHRALGAMRRIHTGDQQKTVTPPSWFVRNDRNKDGDLSSKEFLGNDEQFAALDTDGDGLISGAEAAASEQRSK